MQSPKHCILNKKTGRWIMSKKAIIVLIYHRHKRLKLYFYAVCGKSKNVKLSLYQGVKAHRVVRR
jgi:hypothetical protein